MQAELARCTHCDSLEVQRAELRSAFWHDDRLVVVEGIPGLRCARCGEQFYEDDAVLVLDLLRGRGFDPGEAAHELAVPVFSFRNAALFRGEP